MPIIWIGVGFTIGGIVYLTLQAIWWGPMSAAKRAPRSAGTLEPPRQRGDGFFGLRANWPGLAMIALGLICLLAGATISP